MVLSKTRKAAFAFIAVCGVTALMVAGLFALDVYLHHRAQGLGLNVWGYRGPSVGRKKPGEARMGAFGGSTVFGFGLTWSESWPAFLERQIKAARSGENPATVVNLGVPRDSASTFVATMKDYDYLQCDLVIFYEGYNDLESQRATGRSNQAPMYLAWRHQSPVFRWTGYFPILPLVFNEKAMMLMHGGDLNRAYAESTPNPIVFRPGFATRVTAGALKATADLEVALEQRFGRLTEGELPINTEYDDACGRWSQYCGAMEEAVRYAREQGQRVIVVSQPYLSDLHVDQQQALASSLRRRFGSDTAVRYVNLGRLVDLHDHGLAYDGLHLTSRGNEQIARALLPSVLDLVK